MEKKIIKPADICTTLRLPTRVSAKRPAFSLQMTHNLIKTYILHSLPTYRQYEAETLSSCNVAYMDTEDPFPVPNNPDNKIPIP